MCLLIRADASAQIGSGHIMRCLALARAWQRRGGHASFLSYCESKAIRLRIRSAGIGFIPLESSHPAPIDLHTILMTLEQGHRSDHLMCTQPCVVLDGYHFDASYQKTVQGISQRAVVIDDIANLPRYHASVLLNQNINAAHLTYRCDPGTKLLLGPRYALLRPEFLLWQNWRREIPDAARKVLVTLGGSDPDNVTLKVIRTLLRAEVKGLEAIVVIGSDNPHGVVLHEAIAHSKGNIHLVHNAVNMPELMAWADVAVSAGGSTCWELAFMGLPHIVLVLASNQQGIAEGLALYGLAVNMGWHASVGDSDLTNALRELMQDSARRRLMSQRGRRLVDGDGAARVVAILTRNGK